jgi:hypothetical protein
MAAALNRYVNEFGKYGKGSSDALEIKKLIETDGNVLDDEMTVYRGQSGADFIRTGSWVSTSLAEDVKRFTGVDCCIYEITLLPGTRILDVQETLEVYGIPNKYKGEQEVLVLLDGDFSKPVEIEKMYGRRTFQTTFTPRKKDILIVKRETPEEILKRLNISPDEKEFITEPTDLHAYGVPKNLQEAVFVLLQSGGRFTGRRRRHRTRRFQGRGGRGQVRLLNSRTAKRGRAGSAGRNAGRD